MEGADDSVTVARARELLSQARWRAEREFPGRWGQKTETKLDLAITVNVVRIAAEEMPAIEGEIVGAVMIEEKPQDTV